MSLTDILKAASVVLTMAFAIYGLGAKLRDDQGSLTRAGKVALGGIVAGSLLSIGLQILEQSQRADAAVEETGRYRNLVAASLYGALSTRESWVDMAISIDKRALAPGYAARLDEARLKTKGCRQTDSRGLLSGTPVKSFQCAKYEVLKEYPNDMLRFSSNSSLFPDASKERPTRDLITNAGVRVDVVSRDEERRWFLSDDDKPRTKEQQESVLDSAGSLPGTVGTDDILVGDRLQDTFFEYDGNSLHVLVASASPGVNGFYETKVASVLDLAQKEVWVYLYRMPCGEQEQPCSTYLDQRKTYMKLERFALLFPHGRHIGGIKPDPSIEVRENARGYSLVYPPTTEQLSPSESLAFRNIGTAQWLRNRRAYSPEVGRSSGK